MDLTKEYQEFYAEIYEITKSLPLILHNLEKIVDFVVKFLDNKECRKTIMRILPGLFRDAQKDIYPLFCQKILPQLINILNERTPDVLEDLFKCIAYGLKYLLEEIKKDFEVFYNQYTTNFFASTNKHIQRYEFIKYLHKQ
jgi:hypothetical protein